MANETTIDIDTFLNEAHAFLDSSTGLTGTSEVEQHKRAIYRGATRGEAQRAAEWQRRLFEAGFGWICGPTEFGGRGLPRRYEQAFFELERRYDVPSRGALSISLGMVAPTLHEYGTDALRADLLPALRSGARIGCQLFSEPEAGSDLSAVRTTAQQERDDWILNGQKVWTSGAHYSDLGLILTRTSLEPKYGNLTAFVIDMDADGVEVRPLRQMTGGAEFNEVFLSDVRVPDEWRLGDVGEGWSVAMATLMHERSAIGGSTSGGTGLFSTDALLDWLTALDVLDEPSVADAFARVYSGISAAKAMRRRVTATKKGGDRPGPEMSLAKLALTRNLQSLSDCVSVALGPRLLAEGENPEHWPWAEFVLGVPGMRIGGGTDEVQRNTIGERVLGLPKEPKVSRS